MNTNTRYILRENKNLRRILGALFLIRRRGFSHLDELPATMKIAKKTKNKEKPTELEGEKDLGLKF